MTHPPGHLSIRLSSVDVDGEVEMPRSYILERQGRQYCRNRQHIHPLNYPHFKPYFESPATQILMARLEQGTTKTTAPSQDHKHSNVPISQANKQQPAAKPLQTTFQDHIHKKIPQLQDYSSPQCHSIAPSQDHQPLQTPHCTHGQILSPSSSYQ